MYIQSSDSDSTALAGHVHMKFSTSFLSDEARTQVDQETAFIFFTTLHQVYECLLDSIFALK